MGSEQVSPKYATFQLKALKIQQIQEKLLLPSQLPKFTLDKGSIPGREQLPDTYLPKKLSA